MRKTLAQYSYDEARPIGNGGFAYVYQARDLSDNSTVALKLLKKEFETRREVVQAFFKETQIVRNLGHTNVIRVHDVSSFVRPPFFFTMEFCAGGDLHQRIKRERKMPAPSFLAYAESLAEALGAAHAIQLLHRDIKASNILFRDASTPVLTDFGIAVDQPDIDIELHDRLNVGTPQYMSPEVWLAQPFDVRSDLYSFGVLMYYALTGVFPFSARSNKDVRWAHLHMTPAMPSRYSTDVVRDLDSVIMGLLEKDRRNRIPTAAGLSSEIRRIRETCYGSGQQAPLVPVIFLGQNDRNGITIHTFPFSIGKREGNQLCIRNDDATVSRTHGAVQKQGDGFSFQDSSTNGSIVNGRRVHRTSARLERENTIILGERTILTIRLLPAVDERTTFVDPDAARRKVRRFFGLSASDDQT